MCINNAEGTQASKSQVINYEEMNFGWGKRKKMGCSLLWTDIMVNILRA